MISNKLSVDNIDRWGPGVVAVLALLAVIAIGWTGSARTSKLEGIILTQDREIREMNDDINMFQVYVTVLQRKMIEHSIQGVPDIPHRKIKESQ